MLKDPEMLRRTMQAADDPAAMRSMLQQQDRMLFNILAQPGGANALKRMTRDVGGGGGEGGSGFDALTEKMRLMHLSPPAPNNPNLNQFTGGIQIRDQRW